MFLFLLPAVAEDAAQRAIWGKLSRNVQHYPGTSSLFTMSKLSTNFSMYGEVIKRKGDNRHSGLPTPYLADLFTRFFYFIFAWVFIYQSILPTSLCGDKVSWSVSSTASSHWLSNFLTWTCLRATKRRNSNEYWMCSKFHDRMQELPVIKLTHILSKMSSKKRALAVFSIKCNIGILLFFSKSSFQRLYSTSCTKPVFCNASTAKALNLSFSFPLACLLWTRFHH